MFEDHLGAAEKRHGRTPLSSNEVVSVEAGASGVEPRVLKNSSLAVVYYCRGFFIWGQFSGERGRFSGERGRFSGERGRFSNEKEPSPSRKEPSPMTQMKKRDVKHENIQA